MNTVRFELIELPYPTLARFGLTQEMIEDLPMRVLDEICDGRVTRASRGAEAAGK